MIANIGYYGPKPANFSEIDREFKLTRIVSPKVRPELAKLQAIPEKKRKVLLARYIDPNTVVFPRFLAWEMVDKGFLPTPKCSMNPGNKVEFTPTLNLFDYQKVIINHLMQNIYNPENISAGRSGCILEMEAGLGKTFVAAGLVAKLSRKTLYIVTNELLLRQAMRDLVGIFGENNVGCFYGKQKKDGNIVVAIAKSVLSDKFVPTREFGLTIFDEVQEYVTEKQSAIYQKAASLCVFGITAEANSRADNMDFYAHFSVGKVIPAETIPGFEIPDVDKYKSVIHIIKYAGPPEYTKKLVAESGLMAVYLMCEQLMRDPDRVRLILDWTQTLLDRGHNIFVWCDQREFVEMLSEKIPNSARLMGGASDTDLETAKNSRVIVATYQYAYRGVSLPKFDAMIFATPRRANIYQTLKRIFRMGGDPAIVRQVVDIVDKNTNLKYQLESRLVEYKKPVFGATILKN